MAPLRDHCADDTCSVSQPPRPPLCPRQSVPGKPARDIFGCGVQLLATRHRSRTGSRFANSVIDHSHGMHRLLRAGRREGRHGVNTRSGRSRSQRSLRVQGKPVRRCRVCLRPPRRRTPLSRRSPSVAAHPCDATTTTEDDDGRPAIPTTTTKDDEPSSKELVAGPMDSDDDVGADLSDDEFRAVEAAFAKTGISGDGTATTQAEVEAIWDLTPGRPSRIRLRWPSCARQEGVSFQVSLDAESSEGGSSKDPKGLGAPADRHARAVFGQTSLAPPASEATAPVPLMEEGGSSSST